MNVLATVGAAALLTALGSSAVAAIAAFGAARSRAPRAAALASGGVVTAAAFSVLALGTLATAMMRDDFSLAYVASVSSTDLEGPMKLAALYSSQLGSLLLWATVQAVLLAVFALKTAPSMGRSGPYAVAISGVVIAAFLVPLVFMASPFEVSPVTPEEGMGLNPLLVDRGMLVHPPTLLSGLASTTVPFVIGLAALAAGRVDGAWVRAARPWALFAWLVLSTGNILGGWWAYTVLGWGGYWGWDPVENSAILPLLPLTAFLHSAMVQERRGMLKTWNLALVLSAFALAVFGTFNVRSGLVESVHSFARSNIGPYFLGMLAVALTVSVVLLALRTTRLRAEEDFVSLASRETSMVLNNYVLIAIALVVLGGTLFPVFSELFRDARISVGPPFFNQVVGPLLIATLILISAGTITPWRRAASATLLRRARLPVAAFALGIAVSLGLGLRDPFAIVTIAAAAAIVGASVAEYAAGARGARAREEGTRPSWPAAVLGLLDRDPRRYGGYLVHVGLAVMAIAAVVSTVYQSQGRFTVAPGEQVEFAGYTFAYEGLRERSEVANGVESEVLAPLALSRGDSALGVLEPGRRFFRNFSSQPSALVGLHTTLREDVYTFIEGWDENQVLRVQVYVNPLVAWLWIGAAVYVAGGVLAFAPYRAAAPVARSVTAPAPSRV